MIRTITIEKKTVHFGEGSLLLLAEHLSKMQISHVFLCTDSNLIQLSWFSEFKNTLTQHDIETTLFHDITENPKVHEIRKGEELLKQYPDIPVIAIGGGSVLDATKMITLISEHDGDILDYAMRKENRKYFEKKTHYLIAVPTTAGSGSEMDSGATVINDEEHKISIADSLMSYDAVYEDPSLLKSCPKHILAAYAFDAFSHSYEALLHDSERILDFVATEAVRLVLTHLEDGYITGDSESLNGLLKASFLSGCVLGMDLPNGGMLIHSLSLPLAETYHLSHGHALAICAVPVSRMIYDKYPERIDEIAERVLGERNGTKLIEVIRKICITTNLTKPERIQMNDDSIETMSNLAVKSNTTTKNPILPFNKEMCQDLYQRIAKGNL